MTTLSFDLYWSMRSPYCYLSLDRMLAIERDYETRIDLRVVYPIAVRDPDFFRVRASKHYRPYNLLDSAARCPTPLSRTWKPASSPKSSRTFA
jgi:2-hydroxychromene-2-carboxylate isomerase